MMYISPLYSRLLLLLLATLTAVNATDTVLANDTANQDQHLVVTSLSSREVSHNIPSQPKAIESADENPNRYPYFALLHGIGTCGGVLISKRFVLMSAHCLGNESNFQIRITTETIDDWLIHEEYPYKRGIIHPKYDAATFDYDIALFELKDDVLDGVHFIRVRESPVEAQATPMTAIGIGDIDPSDSVTLNNSILETTVHYFPQSQCSSTMCASLESILHSTTETCIDGGMVHSSMMCAYAEPGGDCESDAGGPLILEGTTIEGDSLVGLASWGFDCSGETPSVYTRISHVYDWIVDSMCAMNPEGVPGYVDCDSAVNILPRDSKLVYPDDDVGVRFPKGILIFGLIIILNGGNLFGMYVYRQRKIEAKKRRSNATSKRPSDIESALRLSQNI
mmetsp:Transcript_15036/g.34861  ORF Transcript_15036/g.34861 Transcript_15036/m.34861 type:complete len:394 (+) Transcript_15036:3-1184(+)